MLPDNNQYEKALMKPNITPSFIFCDGLIKAIIHVYAEA